MTLQYQSGSRPEKPTTDFLLKLIIYKIIEVAQEPYNFGIYTMSAKHFSQRTSDFETAHQQKQETSSAIAIVN